MLPDLLLGNDDSVVTTRTYCFGVRRPVATSIQRVMLVMASSSDAGPFCGRWMGFWRTTVLWDLHSIPKSWKLQVRTDLPDHAFFTDANLPKHRGGADAPTRPATRAPPVARARPPRAAVVKSRQGALTSRRLSMARTWSIRASESFFRDPDARMRTRSGSAASMSRVRERDHERRRMLGVEQGLGLNNQDRASLSRLRAPSRIEVRKPNLAPLTHRRPARSRRIPR